MLLLQPLLLTWSLKSPGMHHPSYSAGMLWCMVTFVMPAQRLLSTHKHIPLWVICSLYSNVPSE